MKYTLPENDRKFTPHPFASKIAKQTVSGRNKFYHKGVAIFIRDDYETMGTLFHTLSDELIIALNSFFESEIENENTIFSVDFEDFITFVSKMSYPEIGYKDYDLAMLNYLDFMLNTEFKYSHKDIRIEVYFS